MAGLHCAVTGEDLSYAANTTKTAVQLTAPAQQRLRLTGMSIGLSGGGATDKAVRVRLLRQTTAGTPGSAQTPVKLSAGSETVQATGGKNYSAEPTAGDVLQEFSVHPNGGVVDLTYPPGLIDYTVPGGGRVGVELANPTGNATVTANVTLRYEE